MEKDLIYRFAWPQGVEGTPTSGLEAAHVCVWSLGLCVLFLSLSRGTGCPLGEGEAGLKGPSLRDPAGPHSAAQREDRNKDVPLGEISGIQTCAFPCADVCLSVCLCVCARLF